MSKPGKRKVELMLPQNEAAEFMKKFAEDLSLGRLVIGETLIPLEGFHSLELALKNEGPGLRVKISVKYPKTAAPVAEALNPEGGEDAEKVPGEDEADEALLEPLGDEAPFGVKVKYKSLKKRMKSSFKAILESLAAGGLPAAGLTHDFVRDCELMATYPDKGEPFYESFLRQVNEFLAAATEGDVAKAHAAALALAESKKACHDRFK